MTLKRCMKDTQQRSLLCVTYSGCPQLGKVSLGRGEQAKIDSEMAILAKSLRNRSLSKFSIYHSRVFCTPFILWSYWLARSKVPGKTWIQKCIQELPLSSQCLSVNYVPY